MVDIDPITQKAFIADEIHTINYYAREIGEQKRMIEKEEDDEFRQWWQYFMYYAEFEMEMANERLTKLRSELADYELRQGQLQPV